MPASSRECPCTCLCGLPACVGPRQRGTAWSVVRRCSKWVPQHRGVRRDKAWLAQDASLDPEPIMLEEGTRLDPVLQALLRSEVGLDAFDHSQLARCAILLTCVSSDMLQCSPGHQVWSPEDLQAHAWQRRCLYVRLLQLGLLATLQVDMLSASMANKPHVLQLHARIYVKLTRACCMQAGRAGQAAWPVWGLDQGRHGRSAAAACAAQQAPGAAAAGGCPRQQRTAPSRQPAGPARPCSAAQAGCQGAA